MRGCLGVMHSTLGWKRPFAKFEVSQSPSPVWAPASAFTFKNLWRHYAKRMSLMIFVIWHSFLVVQILNLNVKVLVAFDQEMAIVFVIVKLQTSWRFVSSSTPQPQRRMGNVNIKSISTIKLYKTMAGKVKCIFSENYLMVNQYCYTQLWVLKWTILGIFSAF